MLTTLSKQVKIEVCGVCWAKFQHGLSNMCNFNIFEITRLSIFSRSALKAKQLFGEHPEISQNPLKILTGTAPSRLYQACWRHASVFNNSACKFMLALYLEATEKL